MSGFTMHVGRELKEINCKEYTSMTNMSKAIIYQLRLDCLVQQGSWVMTDGADWSSLGGNINNILSEECKWSEVKVALLPPNRAYVQAILIQNVMIQNQPSSRSIFALVT